MLVTVLAVFVTNILYLSSLAPGTNIQKMSPISKLCHQHPKIVTKIKSPTSTCHQHLCSPLNLRRLRPWSLQNVMCSYLEHRVGVYHRLIKVLLGIFSLPDISSGQSALSLVVKIEETDKTSFIFVNQI